MKSIGGMRAVLAAAGLSLVMAAPAAWAQAANPMGRTKVTIKPVRVPDYKPGGYQSLNPKKLDWMQLDVRYETMPEWVDELTMTFYVLMKTTDQKEPFALLKGKATFVHIAKGTHVAIAYVAPQLLHRYGKVEGAAVEFEFQGRPVASDSTAGETYKKWLQQLSPKENHVLQPAETPFAPLDWDCFEMLKPKGAQ